MPGDDRGMGGAYLFTYDASTGSWTGATLESLLHHIGGQLHVTMGAVLAGAEEVVIRECNCPFPGAVEKTSLPCRLEANFIASVLGQEARRVSYIPEGHAACTYTFPLGPADPS